MFKVLEVWLWSHVSNHFIDLLILFNGLVHFPGSVALGSSCCSAEVSDLSLSSNLLVCRLRNCCIVTVVRNPFMVLNDRWKVASLEVGVMYLRLRVQRSYFLWSDFFLGILVKVLEVNSLILSSSIHYLRSWHVSVVMVPIGLWSWL